MANIVSDLQKLQLDSILELFTLEVIVNGVPEYAYWHSGFVTDSKKVVYGGITYENLPVKAEGFQKVSQGTQPRPTLTVSNLPDYYGNTLASVVRGYNDLLGAKVTRTRTFVKYIDAINFPGGINPNADPNAYIDKEIWYVDRKSVENRVFLQWELSTAFDVAGVKIPRRQILQNVCPFIYKGAECQWTPVTNAMYDENNLKVDNINLDRCQKTQAACELRFKSQGQPLRFGGFPAVGRIG